MEAVLETEQEEKERGAGALGAQAPTTPSAAVAGVSAKCRSRGRTASTAALKAAISSSGVPPSATVARLTELPHVDGHLRSLGQQLCKSRREIHRSLDHVERSRQRWLGLNF